MVEIITPHNAMQYLKNQSFNAKQVKYSGVPPQWIPATQYSDKTANGLTRCIIDFLSFQGWQAERVNNTGRIVSGRWIKGTGKDGTADISATISGRSAKIEVKIGRDRQSIKQAQYQAAIEAAGGLYVIARTFQGFVDWYLFTFKIPLK